MYLLSFFVIDILNNIETNIESDETNPGPKKYPYINFYHWNVNGLAAHNFVKMFLMEAFITAQNFDIIRLLETFLDSSIGISDTRIDLSGYSLLSTNHPSNTDCGGVCMYYIDYLPVTRKTDVSNLREWLVTEITVSKENWFLTCLYSHHI